LDWRAVFPDVAARGGFDCVVGNPPYVNIRWLARSQSELARDYLRRHYECARGAFDLYAPFVERAHQLLRPGGVCGLIVPNKIASARYAVPCRRLLLERATLLRVVDVTGMNVFPGASVYPYILIWRKQAPSQGHQILVNIPRSLEGLAEPLHRRVRQRDLSAHGGLVLHGFLDVESRVSTQRLDERCRVACGASGFSAQQLAGALVDGDELEGTGDFHFIVSGNIDRYAIRRGNVRFMRRLYRFPRLAADRARLSDAKRALYRAPKIVVAGMTRRLEAAWDADGVALGVQVFAATQFADDPRFLLGLLNSQLLTFLLRQRFRAARLAGGYLAISMGQLARLPIPIDAGRLSQRLIQLVDDRMQRADAAGSTPTSGELAALRRIDRRIDQLVYRLYDLTDSEIQQVERSISGDSFVDGPVPVRGG
jgi:hypothetical protein